VVLRASPQVGRRINTLEFQSKRNTSHNSGRVLAVPSASTGNISPTQTPSGRKLPPKIGIDRFRYRSCRSRKRFRATKSMNISVELNDSVATGASVKSVDVLGEEQNSGARFSISASAK